MSHHIEGLSSLSHELYLQVWRWTAGLTCGQLQSVAWSWANWIYVPEYKRTEYEPIKNPRNILYYILELNPRNYICMRQLPLSWFCYQKRISSKMKSDLSKSLHQMIVFFACENFGHMFFIVKSVSFWILANVLHWQQPHTVGFDTTIAQILPDLTPHGRHVFYRFFSELLETVERIAILRNSRTNPRN